MTLEFLLCSRSFARPRQFVVHSDQPLDGRGLEGLLGEHFGAGPWFCSAAPLSEHPLFTGDGATVISDVPTAAPASGPHRLQLYVVDGPNAGAYLTLHPGTHRVGRCAPLWLEDPAVARVHASVVVDHRQMVLYAEPGAPVQLLGAPRNTSLTTIQLQRGSVIRIGESTLRVQDPLTELRPAEAHWPLQPPQLPVKAPQQRLLTLLMAAAVPLLIGGLLAVFTGSRIFLLISALTGLLALAPLIGLVRARSVYRRSLADHTRRWLGLRQRLAPELGLVLAAALSTADPLPATAMLPPLVFGQGRWFPQAGNSPDGVLGRGYPSPVFALRATGAWQLLSSTPEPALQLLCALLARLLPAILQGAAQLVLDPGLSGLPASLLLLPQVRLGLPPDAVDLARCRGEEPTSPQVIYVVSGAAYPVPGALVIGLGAPAGEQLSGWINLDTSQAQLDDLQAQLDVPQLLSITHFSRLVQRWLSLSLPRVGKAAVAPRPGVLGCLLGEDAAGRAVYLDVAADGPHILLAGTTGSGKSEALRRIIAELVSHYSPQELALALVDFKGGASLSVFSRLPHTQLFSSDLDAAQALRMLQQLEHEISRRERLLAAAACSDITEYIPLQGVTPLPRLVVAIDEFRVFIDQLPEAGARIDRIATVGRALGLHLLLSTQKPSGTLSGQTRANINAVIALRVRDAGESNDLIGTTQAARLSQPGEALLRRANGGPTHFRFRLAAAPTPVGYLAERAEYGFAEYRRLPVGHREPDGAGIQRLRDRMRQITERWPAAMTPINPFAPALPVALGSIPGSEPEPGRLVCGVLDDLAAGRLLPLEIGQDGQRSLLVCGLPEAGPDYLARELSLSAHRLICFDAAAHPGQYGEAHQLLLTGEDTYLFAQALDYLSQHENLPDVLVLVQHLSALLAALPAALWARFEQVLSAVIRGAARSGVRVIILGDRDLTLLKAAQLCTRRWYFPLGASPGLTMSWPKLPAVSALAGRGVQVAADGQLHSIQLTALRGAPSSDTASPWFGEPQRPVDTQRWFLGYTGLEQRQVFFHPSGIAFILVPDPLLRASLAHLLCRRWKLSLAVSEDELLALRAPALLLETAEISPQLVAQLHAQAAKDTTPVVFCAPSPRLAYEFALPGMSVDERNMLLVEATHPFDTQPLNWPVLAARKPERHTEYWRAVKLERGQPAEIRIPRGY